MYMYMHAAVIATHAVNMHGPENPLKCVHISNQRLIGLA